MSKHKRRDAEFIEAYTQWDRAVINDLATVTVLFDSLCLFMEHWLLNKQKPVDLGFGKISASMSRKTWELATYLKYASEMSRRRKRGAVANCPLEEYLCTILAHENMTAWDEEKKVFRWTLNIVPTNSFTSACEALEQDRKRKSAGLYQYVLSGQDQLKRQIPVLYEAFVHFLKEARHPIIILPQSSERGTPLFVTKRRFRTGPKGDSTKTHWKRREYGNKFRRAPLLSKNPVVLGRSLDMGTAQVMAREDGRVFPLSDLQPGNKNMRDTGDNVAKSVDGNAGEPGLLLLDAVEGVAESELLAARSNSGGNGLAGSTQQSPDQSA